MLVALSSSALPDAGLPELIEGCTRRGLAALHLVDGHAHGITPAAPARARAAAVACRDAGIRVTGIEIAGARYAAAQVADTCAALSAQLVVGTAEREADSSSAWNAALAAAGIAVARGVELNAAAENVATAWNRESLAGSVHHVTLRGGGPEAAQHEGRGIGVFMMQLALDDYRGVLALAPSSKAVLPVWRAWLRHGRNWGCGSKAADPALVQLL